MAGGDNMAGVAGPAGHAPLVPSRRPELQGPQPEADQEAGGKEPSALDMQQKAGNSAVSAMLARTPGDMVRSVIGRPGRPIDSNVADMVRQTTGADASGIEVHEGPEAARAAHSVEAEMFASGNHLVAPKGLDVTTREGAFKTIHEVHHIVNQQAKGPVEGTETADGLKISDPADRHEREADAVAAKAVRQHFSGPS